VTSPLNGVLAPRGYSSAEAVRGGSPVFIA
jgi:hypothetical protein